MQQINDLETQFTAQTDLVAHTHLASTPRSGETLDDLLPAFAAVREAAKRTKEMRHFDVQLIGGITPAKDVLPMRNKRAKPMATLPAYLNALSGVSMWSRLMII